MAKGDTSTFEGDDGEWVSIGEKWLTGKKIKTESGLELDHIGSDVDPDELEATAYIDPATGQLVKEGKGWDEIRVKDSEEGRRREYFKRKPAVPVSGLEGGNSVSAASA